MYFLRHRERHPSYLCPGINDHLLMWLIDLLPYEANVFLS